MARRKFQKSPTNSDEAPFACGYCVWANNGTIQNLSFDCPVHAPRDERQFTGQRVELVYSGSDLSVHDEARL